MGLGSCCNIVKYLLVLVNFLFWIAGFTALALFIWVIIDPSVLISITQEQNHFYIGLAMFCVVGVLMIIIAILGCCGSLRESQFMLTCSFCCLLVVLVAEISAGAWAFHNKDKLDIMVRAAVKNTIQNEYGFIDSKTQAFDTFQTHFKCCGATGPNDWSTSKYNNLESTKILNMEISSPKFQYRIPKSCCNENIDSLACDASRLIPIASLINSNIIHEQGCTDKLIIIIKEYQELICLIVIAIIGIELIGLLLSICLCCAIKNDNYKG